MVNNANLAPDFYHHALHSSGLVCLQALVVGDTTIAFQGRDVIGRRSYGLIIGLDLAEWYDYSPSFILVEKLAEWRVTEGIEIPGFDLGDKTYKD